MTRFRTKGKGKDRQVFPISGGTEHRQKDDYKLDMLDTGLYADDNRYLAYVQRDKSWVVENRDEDIPLNKETQRKLGSNKFKSLKEAKNYVEGHNIKGTIPRLSGERGF